MCEARSVLASNHALCKTGALLCAFTCASDGGAQPVQEGAGCGRRQVRRCQQAAARGAHVHDAVVGARMQPVVQQVRRPVRLPARLASWARRSSYDR